VVPAGKAGFARADREKAVNPVAIGAGRVDRISAEGAVPWGAVADPSVTAEIVDRAGRNVASRLGRCPS